MNTEKQAKVIENVTATTVKLAPSIKVYCEDNNIDLERLGQSIIDSFKSCEFKTPEYKTGSVKTSGFKAGKHTVKWTDSTKQVKIIEDAPMAVRFWSWQFPFIQIDANEGAMKIAKLPASYEIWIQKFIIKEPVKE